MNKFIPKRSSVATSVLLSALVILLPSLGLAQGISEGKVRASYIYNFAKNIEWSNQKELEKFSIALFRSDDQELARALGELEDRGAIKNKPVDVSQIYDISELTGYQLVYVDKPSAELISKIYQVIDGRPILLVTLEYTNQQEVMINFKPVTQGRIKFEVNRSNIINQGLKPLPELILNGGSEIDVAKLFRQGQASLIALQKQLAAREASLTDLTGRIAVQETINLEQEQRLRSLNQEITSAAQIVERQKALLKSQSEEIQKSVGERQRLQDEVQTRTTELQIKEQALLESEEKLAVIASQISEREERLASLNKRILSQESQLQKQETEIVALDEQVSSQQVVLRYLWGMVALGILLAVTILVAYFIKQRDNIRLAARSRQLQLASDRLAVAKKKAEQASQAKSDFLSLMSHELRTPLQAIIGYTHVIIEDMEDEGHFNQVPDLQRVVQNGERLLKMINSVLDLAKIEAGKMELALEPCDLKALVEQAKNAVRPQVEKSGNRLHEDVRILDTSPVLDGEKLLHIVINLLSNAAKFTENGKIDLIVDQDADNLYLAVQDTGIGMNAAQQAQVFERFEQADSSTTRKFQGSGLGLSITRQFCVLMGGDILVESEEGRGSKFIVNIPLPIRQQQQESERSRQNAA